MHANNLSRPPIGIFGRHGRWVASSLLLLGAGSLALWGCVGEIGGTGAPSGGSNPGTDRPSDWEPGKSGDPNAAGMLPLRLLTKEEYDNTVNLVFREAFAALDTDIQPAAVLPSETIDESGFLSVGEVSDVSVLRYMDAAKAVADAVAPQLDRVLGCTATTLAEDPGCLRAFIADLGGLLYRRPLDAGEIDEHVAFFDHERTVLGRSARDAALQLLQGMLISPHFLYRWEVGWKVADRQGAVVRLNAFQVASRLSFFLWGSGPDRALLDLAKSDGLDTDAEVRAQAERMLASPRAAKAIEIFHRQWLELKKLDGLFKDQVRFPEWGTGLRGSMQEEIRAFTRYVILEGDGRLATLLGAHFSFVDEALANVYGVPNVSGSSFRKVDLPPNERAGLLTMPGLLAVAAEPSVANPFKRGQLVLAKILCRKLEPPPNIPPVPPPDASDPKPERLMLEELTKDAPCSNCHLQINPLGFALGNFDAIGRYQVEDELGFDVDASGVLPTGERFSGPTELAAALASSDEVRGCMTKQWFRYAYGRRETAADDYSLGAAYERFETSEYDIRQLLLAIVTSRSFLHRTLEQGEVVE